MSLDPKSGTCTATVSERDRRVALAVALPGLAACAYMFVDFALKMYLNGLSGTRHPFRQEHYQAVSEAYSQAFATGFFCCLFLFMLGIVVAAWADQRKRSVLRATAASGVVVRPQS